MYLIPCPHKKTVHTCTTAFSSVETCPHVPTGFFCLHSVDLCCCWEALPGCPPPPGFHLHRHPHSLAITDHVRITTWCSRDGHMTQHSRFTWQLWVQFPLYIFQKPTQVIPDWLNLVATRLLGNSCLHPHQPKLAPNGLDWSSYIIRVIYNCEASRPGASHHNETNVFI